MRLHTRRPAKDYVFPRGERGVVTTETETETVTVTGNGIGTVKGMATAIGIVIVTGIVTVEVAVMPDPTAIGIDAAAEVPMPPRRKNVGEPTRAGVCRTATSPCELRFESGTWHWIQPLTLFDSLMRARRSRKRLVPRPWPLCKCSRSN